METFESLLATVTTGEDGLPVVDPATGQELGRAPERRAENLDHTVAAARAAQPAREALGHEERSRVLNAAADAVDRSAEALARLFSREQGKPLNGLGSRFEVGGVTAWVRTAATTPLEPERILDDESDQATLSYRAAGLVGAIGPWNWPAGIATWQLAPALRMGNAVVVKPSEHTPLAVLALAAIVNQVLPDGVLTVLTGDGDLGAAMAAHPAFDKLMFTGSTRTGRAIVASSASSLPRLTLELGGNDPGIVLPDADPAAIAENLFWGAFINTGQTCAALKRLYVHEAMHDDVVDALAAVAARMPMGPGIHEDSMLGPLTTADQFRIVDSLVVQAKATGGRLVVGGDPDRDALLPWVYQSVHGGTHVIVPAFEPAAVPEAIQRHQVTHTALIPALLQQLLDHPSAAERDLSSLQHLTYAAAPITQALLERAMKALPQVTFQQIYGMTELLGAITTLTPADHREGTRLRSAGRALVNTEVRVVDTETMRCRGAPSATLSAGPAP
jgi:acyl-CoA reductase-like NAD-dependent aldehyde dehydrogenase